MTSLVLFFAKLGVTSGNILISVYVGFRILKVCPACKDKAESKCMGSAGGKTPTEPKLSILL
jgi:hypothetical protein